MPALHAKVGPSTLKRVINCPGSVRELEKLDRKSNDAADEGSCLHTYCEDILKSDGLLEPHDLIGREYEHNGYRLTITEAHADFAVPAIDWLRDQPGQLFIEQQVRLDPWMADQFGTGDIGNLQPMAPGDVDLEAYRRGLEKLAQFDWAAHQVWKTQELLKKDYFKPHLAIIFDWKWGEGVPVKVADNPQLKGYGLGFLFSVFVPAGIIPATFRLIIEQPRNSRGGRYYEPWDISLEDLLDFGEALRIAYTRTCDPDAPLCAGEWCSETFCDKLKTETGCGAYNRWMADLLDAKFDELAEGEEVELQDPDDMTPERRGRIVVNADHIRRWLAKLHEDSEHAAASGRPDPGTKQIAGQRGNRYFRDEEEAELIMFAALGDDAYTHKLKSITQAEKTLKPGRKRVGNKVALDLLNALVGQDEGKPILVAANDPRPALQTIEDKFDDMSDDTETDDLFD